MVSVIDFYAASFLFFELGQGFETHLVQPFLFVCKVCFYCWYMLFSISTETFMPVDIRDCAEKKADDKILYSRWRGWGTH